MKTRRHFDSPSFPLRREISVFINCPFDQDFEDSFFAIVFCVVCCGFVPRCAFESRSDAEPRMARILKAIRGSKYSVHDLSRCRGEGDENLARFNMPLELGMAMAERFAQRVAARRHDWLPLVLRGAWISPVRLGSLGLRSSRARRQSRDCGGCGHAVARDTARREDLPRAPPGSGWAGALPAIPARPSANLAWPGTMDGCD
jgi:hypothetical protein